MFIVYKRHDKNYINYYSNNKISLGYEFEKEFGRFNFMNFYSVFNSDYDFKIFEGNNEIGTLDVGYALMLSPGEDFVLAGHNWEILSIDYDKYLMNVRSKSLIKRKIPRWSGGGKPFSYIVCRKVYEILLGSFNKDYLKPLDSKSQETIVNLIYKADECGFRDGIIPVFHDYNKNQVYIYTFAGLKANVLLSELFNMNFEIKNEEITNLYYSLNCENFTMSDLESLIINVEKIINEQSTERYMDDKTISFKKNKFIEYVPNENSGKLKLEILYDKEGLMDVTMNNKVEFVDGNSIYKFLSKWPNI